MGNLGTGLSLVTLGLRSNLVTTNSTGTMDLENVDSCIAPDETAKLIGNFKPSATETIHLYIQIQKETVGWTNVAVIYDDSVSVTAGVEYQIATLAGEDITWTPVSTTGQFRWLISVTHEDASVELWASYFEVSLGMGNLLSFNLRPGKTI